MLGSFVAYFGSFDGFVGIGFQQTFGINAHHVVARSIMNIADGE